jgi:hypothetical protein
MTLGRDPGVAGKWRGGFGVSMLHLMADRLHGILPLKHQFGGPLPFISSVNHAIASSVRKACLGFAAPFDFPHPPPIAAGPCDQIPRLRGIIYWRQM